MKSLQFAGITKSGGSFSRAVKRPIFIDETDPNISDVPFHSGVDSNSGFKKVRPIMYGFGGENRQLNSIRGRERQA